MNIIHAFVVFILLLSDFVTSQRFLKGRCPPTPVLKNFDWNRYLGKWFEQERYFTFYQEIGRCWTGTYLKSKRTGRISVKLTFQDIVFKKPQKIFVDVFAKRPYEAPNKLTYTIPGIPFFEDHYEVLSTDYETYTIEYSCTNKHPFGHFKFAWILTRSPHPSYSVISRAKDEMKQLGIQLRYLERSPQSCYDNPHYGRESLFSNDCSDPATDCYSNIRRL